MNSKKVLVVLLEGFQDLVEAASPGRADRIGADLKLGGNLIVGRGFRLSEKRVQEIPAGGIKFVKSITNSLLSLVHFGVWFIGIEHRRGFEALGVTVAVSSGNAPGFTLGGHHDPAAQGGPILQVWEPSNHRAEDDLGDIFGIGLSKAAPTTHRPDQRSMSANEFRPGRFAAFKSGFDQFGIALISDLHDKSVPVATAYQKRRSTKKAEHGCPDDEDGDIDERVADPTGQEAPPPPEAPGPGQSPDEDAA